MSRKMPKKKNQNKAIIKTQLCQGLTALKGKFFPSIYGQYTMKIVVQVSNDNRNWLWLDLDYGEGIAFCLTELWTSHLFD